MPYRAKRFAWGKALAWYFRELLGENAYDKYLVSHAKAHPGSQPLTRRQFYRRRGDQASPTGCC